MSGSEDVLNEIKQDDSKSIDYRKEVKLLERLFIDEILPFDEKEHNIKI